MIRAKFRLESKTPGHYDPNRVGYSFSAVNRGDAAPPSASSFDGEDSVFGKWTPSGSISMVITNPEVHAQLEVGKSYYVDFTPAE